MKLRKGLSLVLVVAVLAAMMSCALTAFAGDALTPVISNSADTNVGDTLTVTVSLPENSGAAGGSFNLVYDGTKATLTEDPGAVAGALIETCSNTVNPAYADNTIRCNFANSVALSAEGGELLVATFDLIDAGDAVFSVEDFALFDANALPLACEDDSITVTVTTASTVLYGDINNDDQVDSSDALYFTRNIAGWPDYAVLPCPEAAADLNCDGVVDSSDSLIMVRHIAGWPAYAVLPIPAE